MKTPPSVILAVFFCDGFCPCTESVFFGKMRHENVEKDKKKKDKLGVLLWNFLFFVRF